MKDWSKILMGAIVFLTVVFAIRTAILIMRATISCPATPSEIAVRNTQPSSYSAQNGIREDYALDTYQWSRRVKIHPNDVSWSTYPAVTLKVIRDGDPRTVVIIHPGEHPRLGDPDYLQFIAVGAPSTLTVRRQ